MVINHLLIGMILQVGKPFTNGIILCSGKGLLAQGCWQEGIGPYFRKIQVGETF